jgi:hypothetical protein
MKRPVAIGVAAACLVLTVLTELGCSDTQAHWVLTSIEPPPPGNCLKICVRVKELAGETMQIYNGCTREALTLTGPYFAPIGTDTFSWDGAVTAFTDNVAPGQTGVFVASLPAAGKTEFTLTGNLGGTFETLVIDVADGGAPPDVWQPLCNPPDGGFSSLPTASNSGFDAGSTVSNDAGVRPPERDAGSRDAGSRDAGSRDGSKSP